jgi:16S rRNA (uracil1498-N3)-methyltransferase
MKLPLFYKSTIEPKDLVVLLDEPASKHIVQVLRMHVGELLQLTNGKGDLFTAEITDDNRKKCAVKIIQTHNFPHSACNVSIAISPIKNNTRFEWFLEKATEIGITEIIPIICERTEKQHFKWERMNSILVSAMLQSQQVWLPVLQEPVKYVKYIEKLKEVTHLQKYIAHCEDGKAKEPLTQHISKLINQVILIGPEGDFSTTEINAAIHEGFIPVTLGHTRLRTETAGIVAATLFRNL